MSELNRLAIETLIGRPCSDGTCRITDIASSPQDNEWQWQLSMIDMEQRVEFPAHADIRRQFVPLDAPVDISFPGGRTKHLHRFEIIQLDQANEPEACTPESPTRAFNLKLRGNTQGELMARPLNGVMVLLAPGGWRWFLLLLSGQAQVIADHRSQSLSANDMLWIEPALGHPIRIEGGGEIVLVRLRAD